MKKINGVGVFSALNNSENQSIAYSRTTIVHSIQSKKSNARALVKKPTDTRKQGGRGPGNNVKESE